MFTKNNGHKMAHDKSNTELWLATIAIIVRIRKRKWRLVGHTVRKRDESVKKQALDWNQKGARRTGRPKQSWKRTAVEEAEKCGKTWSEVQRMAGNRVKWRGFANDLCT